MENDRNVRTCKVYLQSVHCFAKFGSCTFSDTLFVDLSQYTEKTVPRLRELFTYWLTKARWHQPSIMIFDNIDQLMPPQAEVSGGREL